MMTALTHFTIAGAREGLRKKAFSARELAEAHITAVAETRPLNAYLVETPERALEMASASDARLARGDAGALEGIPIAIKDLFCTDGIQTTAGSRILEGFKPPYESTVTANLWNAGATMLGKVNMDEFAMGSSNETSYYGPVKNPWDTAKVPGGSSGGSAAATAARLTPLATGTDTGGSIRQPAALTGVTGLKPTYGRVSRYGMIAFASSLDQAGVFARSAGDAAAALQVMAGFDPRDSTSVDVPVPDYSKALGHPLKGMKIGLLREFFDGLEPRNSTLLEDALNIYTGLGAETLEVSLPHLPLSVPTYYVVAPAECSSNLSRFDGVRYGYRCDNPKDLMDLYKRSRGEGFGAEVKRRIMTGTYVLSAGYFDAYYLKAQKARRLITDDFRSAFEKVDLVIGPTTPTPAFDIGAKMNDPVLMYLNDIYTIGANLAGLPGVSVPCGFVDRLPMGLQLIGPHFAEAKLLNAAHQYQQATDWHTHAPRGYES
jgi:aspartyl-tRNA(Asn)/glutamyl-tRNA(Gln) amidotransferase subunit A